VRTTPLPNTPLTLQKRRSSRACADPIRARTQAGRTVETGWIGGSVNRGFGEVVKWRFGDVVPSLRDASAPSGVICQGPEQSSIHQSPHPPPSHIAHPPFPLTPPRSGVRLYVIARKGRRARPDGTAPHGNSDRTSSTKGSGSDPRIAFFDQTLYGHERVECPFSAPRVCIRSESDANQIPMRSSISCDLCGDLYRRRRDTRLSSHHYLYYVWNRSGSACCRIRNHTLDYSEDLSIHCDGRHNSNRKIIHKGYRCHNAGFKSTKCLGF